MTTRAREISNNDDIVDSRDVIARIEVLESEQRDHWLEVSAGKPDDERGDTYFRAWLRADALDNPEGVELATLLDLQDEAKGYCANWYHGAALIRDSYFEDYAHDLAESIGAIGKDTQWPATHINWDAAADELKMDYTSVEWDGVTYWVR